MQIVKFRQRLVSFNCNDANLITTNKGRYFLLCENKRYYVVNAACPHRQGPLHLGTVSDDGKKILCPMHGLGTSKHSLCKKALPCVYRNGFLTVILGSDETLVALQKMSILVNEEKQYDEMCFT